MISYQTLLNTAATARARALAELSELRLAASNLRNELEGQIQAPEEYIQVAQSGPNGSLQVVDGAKLDFTEEHTVEFHFQVQLVGSRSILPTLTVPASVSRTELGIICTVGDGTDPHIYNVGNNAGVIKLIVDSLARQAGDVGV